MEALEFLQALGNDLCEGHSTEKAKWCQQVCDEYCCRLQLSISMRTSIVYHCELILPSDCNHLHLVILTYMTGFSESQTICGALDSYEWEEYNRCQITNAVWKSLKVLTIVQFQKWKTF